MTTAPGADRERMQNHRKRKRLQARQQLYNRSRRRSAPIPEYVSGNSPILLRSSEDHPHHDPIPNRLIVHEPVSLGPQNLDEEFTLPEVRDEALRSVFQFRAPPIDSSPFSVAVSSEMACLRQNIEDDLKANADALDPDRYTVCSSCGHQERTSNGIRTTERTRDKWCKLLGNQLYVSNENSRHFFVCRSCANILRASRVLSTAFQRGLVFTDAVPNVLSVLNKYERLLISLRLPCIYAWRAQGGYGQFACRGVVSFSNPVATLAISLPHRASAIFSVLSENGQRVELSAGNIRSALVWLKTTNPLYADIEICEEALRDIALTESDAISARPSSSDGPSTSDVTTAANIEQSLGAQGPVDGEALHFSSQSVVMGTEDLDNIQHCKLLIEHMLRPFNHLRNDMVPSYDAAQHLEAYFPVHFLYGYGGPASTNIPLGNWIKNALLVHDSRFARDLDFIFFVTTKSNGS